MATNLILEANNLLKDGGFEYAFCGGQAIDLFLGYESRVHGDIDICVYWEERDKIIAYMQAKGFDVYEMLGGGKAHHITDLSNQRRLKKNIFCFLEGCPLVKTYPPDEDGNCWMEFFHVGQTQLNFIEFLFNDKSADTFEYARNREIKREMGKAILDKCLKISLEENIPYHGKRAEDSYGKNNPFFDKNVEDSYGESIPYLGKRTNENLGESIPFLAPEICLLYKAKELEREGYQQDFDLAYEAMNDEQKNWLQNALRVEYPQGHKWLKEKLFLHAVTNEDAEEVAKTWPSDHTPLSLEEANGVIHGLQDNYSKNTKGCVFHLCLALCRESDPGVIMGWCGLDGTRSHTEPEIFIILNEAYQNKGYGSWCVKEILRMAVEEYDLQSVHGGCAKDNIASGRVMEKAGMVQYGTQDNGDPVFRFVRR